ncbi:MAG: APC family permease [Actinomycetota bacterium]|nr:APC family permease [Actinomycetota bacterium]
MTAGTVDRGLTSDDGGKGLKTGALGLVSSVVIGVASTAPAYSLAATLGLIVALIGLQSPAVVLLAFVPILFVSVGYQQLNKAEPDCGTTFTWATKAFGPKSGWMGGWGIIAADVLVMASLAQVAGQYVFLLFGADGIGSNPTSGWVLLVGMVWMALMTYICYRGIEISAAMQRWLLTVEVIMLAILAIFALVKVYGGHGVSGTSIHPAWSWFNPANIKGDNGHFSFNLFSQGILLMLFIYWGWDSAVSVNEETKDRDKTPGRAAIISTVLLLAIYAVVSVAAQAFAGVGTTGIGLGNADNSGDVLSVLGHSVFGGSGFGTFMSKLLLFMVLTSAAASTQTTILPTARTTLSMAVYKAIPATFAKVHPRYFTPTSSTLWMGGVSAALYLAMNYFSHGGVIADAVTAIGILIAFYYGATGFACTWYYRDQLTNSAKDFLLKGLIPFLGGAMLWVGMVLTTIQDWKPVNSYVVWNMHFAPHWQIGFAFLLGVGSLVVGVILMLISMPIYKAFFSGQSLNRDTPVYIVEGEPLTAGLTLPDSTERMVLPPDQVRE